MTPSTATPKMAVDKRISQLQAEQQQVDIVSDDLSDVLSRLDITELPEIISRDAPSGDINSLASFKDTYTHFLKRNSRRLELSLLKQPDTKTLIVLSPLSVKHAFGRHWISKTYTNTSIVERPQRLLACALGISAAISKFPCDYSLYSSVKRSSLLSEHVKRVHGTNWPEHITRLCLESEAKLKERQIEVPSNWDSGDIYLTKNTIDALEGCVGAVESAIDSILAKESVIKKAFVAIRPPGHHGHPCTPSGFCLINNAQIGIEYAAINHDVTHAVVLDFDLHHGDGTQDICWSRAGFEPDLGEVGAGYADSNPKTSDITERVSTDPRVGYFSLHDINSFPTEEGYAVPINIKNASTCVMSHDLNIWNIHLKKYQTDEEFYTHYDKYYKVLLDKAEEFLIDSKIQYESEIEFDKTAPSDKKSKSENVLKRKPFKAMIVLSSGFDASEYEYDRMQRHGAKVPTSFYQKFTSSAVDLANKYCDGVLLSVLEGGYSDKAISSGVFSHLVGLQQRLWNNEWGSSEAVKEMVKGCKPNWHPIKAPNTAAKYWGNQIGTLGRAMLPEAIINQKPVKEEAAEDHPQRYLRSGKQLPSFTESSASPPSSATPIPSTPCLPKESHANLVAQENSPVVKAELGIKAEPPSSGSESVAYDYKDEMSIDASFDNASMMDISPVKTYQ